MKTDKQRKTQFIVLLTAVFSVAMIMFPKITEMGSKTAIALWINSIVPVMLPFFIFSDFIKRTGDLGKLPPVIYPFAVAFLSGYPMGAKVVGDFVKENKITVNKGKSILSYSLVTGPAFIIFTVGTFIGSQKAAAVIAAAHYVGAFINGLVFRNNEEQKVSAVKKSDASDRDYLENFTESIVCGFKAMAMILAYLMFFTIGITLLEYWGMFSILKHQWLDGFVKGIFEMTIGINFVGLCDISIKMKAVLASFLVSFGGLSVIGQSVSMTAGTGIGVFDILKIKISHGIFTAVITVILMNLMVI